jgi:soluble lytic murein transglycosylase-like protein
LILDQCPKPLIYLKALIAAALLLLVQSAEAAAIYKYRDRNGVVNYTNVKPIGVNPQVVMVYCPACDPRSKVDYSRIGINTVAYGPEIQAAISKNPVDEALVRAIIQAESAYNPNALSRAGARGLMQLMPPTAQQYGVIDSYNAAQNIQGGVAYLRFLMDFFDGDVRLASAAYNAGENNVLKYAGVPPFAETQVYVKRVAQLYERYRGEIAKRQNKAAAPALAAQSAARQSATPAAAAAGNTAATALGSALQPKR